MNFKLSKRVGKAYNHVVKVGNVYPAKGSARRVIAMWVVVGVREDAEGNGRVHLIGLNNEAMVTSTASYGLHAFRDREMVGYVPGLDKINLTVEPYP